MEEERARGASAGLRNPRRRNEPPPEPGCEGEHDEERGGGTGGRRLLPKRQPVRGFFAREGFFPRERTWWRYFSKHIYNQVSFRCRNLILNGEPRVIFLWAQTSWYNL